MDFQQPDISPYSSTLSLLPERMVGPKCVFYSGGKKDKARQKCCASLFHFIGLMMIASHKSHDWLF